MARIQKLASRFLVALSLVAAPAHATIVPVEIDLRIVFSDLFVFVPGSITTLHLTIDDARPDGDPALDRGLFTNVGGIETAPLPGVVFPLSRLETYGSAAYPELWRAAIAGPLGDPSAPFELALTLDLVGTLPDVNRPAPRFAGGVSGQLYGTIWLGSPLGLTGDVLALRVVPEPGSGVLLTAALLALAGVCPRARLRARPSAG